MKEKKLERLTDAVYFMPPEEETDRPVLAAICGRERTLIMDAGNSASHASLLLEALAERQITKLHAVVLTHCHWDHVFGADRLNLPVIAHLQTKQALENMAKLSWTDEALDERVREGSEFLFCADMIKKEFAHNRDILIRLPDQTFADKLNIDLGGVRCIVEHVGGDHSSDSTIIYVAEDGRAGGVLFLGDCMYPDLGGKYTVQAVLDLLEKLDRYDADCYVLSHEMPLSRNEYLEYSGLLKLLCSITVEAEGELHRILQEYTRRVGKEPGEIELEAIHCFVNGWTAK